VELHAPAKRIGEIVHERRRVTSDSETGAIFSYQRRVLAEFAEFL